MTVNVEDNGRIGGVENGSSGVDISMLRHLSQNLCVRTLAPYHGRIVYVQEYVPEWMVGPRQHESIH